MQVKAGTDSCQPIKRSNFMVLLSQERDFHAYAYQYVDKLKGFLENSSHVYDYFHSNWAEVVST